MRCFYEIKKFDVVFQNKQMMSVVVVMLDGIGQPNSYFEKNSCHKRFETLVYKTGVFLWGNVDISMFVVVY